MSEKSLVDRLRELSADLSVWQLNDAEQAMYEAADRIEALEAQLSNSEPVAWMAENGDVLSAHDKKDAEWRHVLAVKRYSIPLFAAPVVSSHDAEDGLSQWEREELTEANALACGCRKCSSPMRLATTFIVCPECGNKRCPKANDHRHQCTGSNASGQPGSAWEHVKSAAPTKGTGGGE